MATKADIEFLWRAFDNAQNLIARMDVKAAGLVALVAVLEAGLAIAATGVDKISDLSIWLFMVSALHAVSLVVVCVEVLLVHWARGRPGGTPSLLFPGDVGQTPDAAQYLRRVADANHAHEVAGQVHALGQIYAKKAAAINRAVRAFAIMLVSWLILISAAILRST